MADATLHARRRPRSLLAAAALALVPQAWAAPPDAGTVDDDVRGAFLADGAARGDEEILARLARLDAGAVPVLFGVATGERMDLFVDGESGAPAFELGRGPERFNALAVRALGRFPDDVVLKHLEARVASAPSSEAGLELRLTALAVIGELGSSHGVEPFLAVTEELGPRVLTKRRVRTRVVAALASLLGGHWASWQELRERALGLDAVHVEIVLDAVDRVPRPEAVELLRGFVGRGVETDARVVERIASLVERFPWWNHGDVAAVFRSLGSSADWRARAAVASALGRVGGPESANLLLQLLKDESRSVRAAARASLRGLTGVDLEDDEPAWRRWLARERAWHAENDERVLADLRSDRPEAVAGALAELVQHPLHRHRFAVAVATLVHGPTPEASLAACGVLVRLGSRLAVPRLVEALDHGDESVRRAAWTTLCELTGEMLPPRREAWRGYAR